MTGFVNRALMVYSAVASTVLLCGAASVVSSDRFKTIDVERINVREPDGTLRMVISNRTNFPGTIVRGKELPHAGRTQAAGMLFFNDEATENGGLIFGGVRDKDGKVSAGGHLSFDQYEQDQVINLEQTEDGDRRSAGLGINDRPSQALDFAEFARIEAMPDGAGKDAAYRKLEAQGAFGAPRLYVGKANNDSVLTMRDAQGHKRLVLKVTAAGDASIQFLDAEGRVVRTVTPVAQR